MDKFYRNKADINPATKEYIEAILEAGRNNTNSILTIEALAFLFAKVKNFKKKHIVWFQGIRPEEARMIGSNFVTCLIWNILEYFALKTADIKIFVSQSMLDHYKKKYNISPNNYIIQACFNKNILNFDKWNISKYSTPSFVYAGSMSKWQCIDDMLALFIRIQKKMPNASLAIFTADIATAHKKLEAYGVENALVSSVPLEEIDYEISKYKYGFVVRDDSIVNIVSTPTKINSYLSVGTIPIVSKSIGFTNDIHTEYFLKISSDLDEAASEVLLFNEKILDARDLYKAYSALFSELYSVENFKKKITDLINS
ncbi:hypothetical protein PWG14_23840 [Chromobacterium amazonense]|uniref:hypothetical protein n=1 Tax=Chromobacterium amazonense TaxID=1382803 RepID=UPI00237DB6A3|nr:hypothetical protein [Chromobacterium amazonense]MDE1715499.1 hypothetical protein [Chromobacterium amazonense]